MLSVIDFRGTSSTLPVRLPAPRGDAARATSDPVDRPAQHVTHIDCAAVECVRHSLAQVHAGAAIASGAVARVGHGLAHLGHAIVGAAVAVGAAARGVCGSIGRAIDHFATGARFVAFGMIFKAEQHLTEAREKRHKPLQDLPIPTIHRPFVLIPGWTTEPEAFQPLVDFLTRDGHNGGETYYVKQGAFYTMDATGALQPAAAVPHDAKVFEMVYSDPRQAPDRNVIEMRQNFAAITAATGEASLDCQGYSMGGIDARLYLDQGGTAMHRLMLLGTPNRGTQFAPLADAVITKQVKWAENFGGLVDNDHDSLVWLTHEDKSAPLRDLNSRWAAQQAAAPILTVGCDLLPTASPHGFLGLQGGDGLVPAPSLALPGGNTIVLHESMQHGRLNDDETVQHIRSLYFGWDLPVGFESKFPSYDAKYLNAVPRP